MGRRRSLADLSYSLVIGTLAALALLIIVAPVVIVLTTSFTEGRSLKFPPTGFSLQWYEALFDASKSRQIHRAVYNSLEVAAWSTGIGIVLGSMSVRAVDRKSETGTLSIEAMKARNAPAKIPGAISGRVTRRSV